MFEEENDEKEQLDLTKLRFVLYARKSTEDEGSQFNSIPDQITYCEDYAARHGLTIVDTITEEASAKFSGNRPRFKQMMKDIKDGKYDAILAYHPDRLSRNMLEAGQILDMLTPDKRGNPPALKTLAFSTVAFSNDPSNRLTLAVLFSLATNFSEHLSEMVKRTTDSNLKRGISVGTPKWGYDINPQNQHYEPNKDYDLIRKGFLMIKDGKTQKEVVEFWNKSGLKRNTKITRKNKTSRTIQISTKTTPTIFRDPFAYGVLEQNGKKVILNEVYSEGFKSLVTGEEWNKIQTKLPINSRKRTLSNSRTFMPFRGGFLKCGVCGSSMYVSPSTSSGGTRYIYAACQNKSCKRKHKSIRLKDIITPLCKVLHGIKVTDEDYNHYLQAVDNHLTTITEDLKKERNSYVVTKKMIEQQNKELLDKYAAVSMDKEAPKSVKTNLKKEIAECEKKLEEVTDAIKAIDEELKDPSNVKLTSEAFLNLMKTIEKQMKTGDVYKQDRLARILFSNITIDDKNKLTYLCKPEFDGLLKSSKKNSGAPD